MRSRPGPTKISIWMATSLLSIKNETYPHIENYQYVSTHQYGFSCEPLCDNNQILDISQLLPRFNLRNDYGNFFTAHISQEGIQLCVRGTATVSLVLEDFTCRTLDDRRNLIDYGKLRGPPRTWTATFWADQKELETMEKLPSPKLNPFNSSRTYYFYDIPYYLAVVVVQRSGCFTPSFKNEYASNECYRFFSDSVEDPDTKIGSYNLYCARAEIFNEFLEFDITNNPTFENLTKENLLELLLTNPAHSYIPSGYSHEKQNYSASELQGLVEKDMINCNEKSAFIAATEIALAERDFLRRNYPSKKFHIWNTFFGPFKYGWLFQPVAGSTTSSGVSVVHRNFQALVVSGIYDRVRNEILRGMWLGRKPVANDTTEIVSKIEINGRIRTIFILCGVLICLAFAAVLVEGYKCEYNLLVKMFFKSASFLVKCRNFLRDNGITCGKIKRKRNYWAAPPVVNKVYIPPQLPAAGPRSP
ncbi:hypothetical protein Fcan01_28234 [Folsomia candida]|uniref:Uncharacterized protein n=1 Tax=Folsomia candida TaxID=158441 RepID=A0A226CY68_FOLCA|nr:hypothetical protein Fcan01_28234 [Folsomia candida]